MTHMEYAYFGGGCFWCTEAAFSEIRGVLSVVPGYAGGSVPDPSYEQVSTGDTGHAEVVKVGFDSATISYRDLLAVFFGIHDPTTKDRQGGDVGTQYRSIVLYADDAQKSEVEAFVAGLAKELAPAEVTTEIAPLREFYEAEEYHHGYFRKNPDKRYCQLVINPKLAKLRKEFARYLKDAS